MKISKIPIPGSTRLVEIAYEDTTAVVYFLDENGEIVDHLTVEDTSVVELKQLLPFMFIIAVTPQQQWEVSCAGMYNQIFEPCMNSIFSPLAWEMSKELVDCIGINEEGNLIIKNKDGKLEEIMSGEVSIRGVKGYV